jgi:phosphoglucomutase
LVSLTKKGKEGVEEIMMMMENFRNETPTELNGEKVTRFFDYQSGIIRDLVNNTTRSTEIDHANVLQFETEKGSLITVRPSGTEPKIKFYFSVKAPLNNKAEFKAVNQQLENKLDNVMKSLSLA